MTDEIFQGTFEPPSIGMSGTPIGMTGTGSLAITPDALIVKGFHGGGALLPLLALVTVTGAGLGAAWLVSTQLFHHDTLSSGGAGGAIGAGVLSAAAVPKRSSKRPFELAIPWASVKKVMWNAQNKHVQITIKKHKPSGVLHFKPAGETPSQAVINAVQMKII